MNSKSIEFIVPAADCVLKHIFECGQCFRWEREDTTDGAVTGMRDEDTDKTFKDNADTGECENRSCRSGSGAYIGIAGGRAARVSLRQAARLSLRRTAGGPDSDAEEQQGSDKAVLRIEQLSEPGSPEEDRLFWKNYFDLDTDYGKIKEELSKDKTIRRAIPFGHGIRILKQDPWETTVSFIISQNNNIPRIKKNIRDLAKLAGEKVSIVSSCDRTGASEKQDGLEKQDGPEKTEGADLTEASGGQECLTDREWYEVPGPEKLARLTVEDLAPVRLGYRARYLIETARCVCEKGLDVLTDDLDSLCGVGPKVASCIRLFGLNDTASFPVDVWVKRVMKELYGIDKPAEIAAFAEKTFGEYGGMAQQYLFYYMREKD